MLIGWNNKMEEKKEHAQSGGKLKIILGSLSLLTVFSTPYLNITQLSLNMNLFQSAAYSFILLGFWLIAGSLLREKQPTHETIHFPESHHYSLRHKNPAVTA
jgi:hypothetical protein